MPGFLKELKPFKRLGIVYAKKAKGLKPADTVLPHVLKVVIWGKQVKEARNSAVLTRESHHPLIQPGEKRLLSFAFLY